MVLSCAVSQPIGDGRVSKHWDGANSRPHSAGQISSDCKGVSGFHQGIQGLLSITKAGLIRSAPGDDPALEFKQRVGTAVGETGCKPFSCAQLLSRQDLVRGKRVAFCTDTHDALLGQFPVDCPFWGVVLKGEAFA